MSDERFLLHTRVSDVLYPFSGIKDVPKEIVENAAKRGTVVHQFCDSFIDGLGEIGLETAVRSYENEDLVGHFEKELELVKGFLKSFKDWAEGKKFLPKAPRFFCDTHWITGEADRFYEEEDGIVLVDFKTPASESKSWLLQGSAYSYLAKLAGFPIKRIEFIRLSRAGGKAKIHVYEENWPLFLAHLEVYRYNYANKEEFQANIIDYL